VGSDGHFASVGLTLGMDESRHMIDELKDS
jgi:hypothetical protein